MYLGRFRVRSGAMQSRKGEGGCALMRRTPQRTHTRPDAVVGRVGIKQVARTKTQEDDPAEHRAVYFFTDFFLSQQSGQAKVGDGQRVKRGEGSATATG
jgi:hypothetical protein